MSHEIRRDPLTGEHVVLATERVTERKPAPVVGVTPAECPFCPGHEPYTRPTIAAIERDGAWTARAFANRWPMLVVEEKSQSKLDGPYESWAGVGAHEVIVEAPEHAALHTLPVRRTEDALALAVSRIRDLRNDRRLSVLQWFRNQGAGAGASQTHPHAQIVGLPIVPDRIRMMMARARHWLDEHQQTLLASVIAAERKDGSRMLIDGPEMVAFCAFAPRHPFEVWFVPTAPVGTFGDATPSQLRALAEATHRVSRALVSVHGEVSLTTVALGAPDHEPNSALGWHVRMAPRLLSRAGLEEATGLSVHSVLPEGAAGLIRRALLD